MSRSTLRAVLCVICGYLLVQAPVAAHHSTLPFDSDHATTLKGVVTAYEWRNPHSFVRLDVNGEAGHAEHWTIETESLLFLRKLGWTKDMLKPGDAISVTGAAAKDGTHLMRCKTLALPDGRELTCFPSS
jgi:hypothetical protein